MQSSINHAVVEATDLVANIKAQMWRLDVAFVGEGTIDFQTQYSKTPMGAAKRLNGNLMFTNAR